MENSNIQGFQVIVRTWTIYRQIADHDTDVRSITNHRLWQMPVIYHHGNILIALWCNSNTDLFHRWAWVLWKTAQRSTVVSILRWIFYIMPYYGLFSHDLHILDLQWRSPLCSLPFCGYYICVHYFYVLWLIMTSQWVITLLGMPHCDTTMGNNVARDILYDVTMDNDIAMYT